MSRKQLSAHLVLLVSSGFHSEKNVHKVSGPDQSSTSKPPISRGPGPALPPAQPARPELSDVTISCLPSRAVSQATHMRASFSPVLGEEEDQCITSSGKLGETGRRTGLRNETNEDRE